MKNTKNLMDAVTETSSKTVNNWVETAEKAQKATMSGNGLEKNAELYKEWLNNQMSIFRNITLGNDEAANNSETKSTENKNQSADYLQNWYTNQMASAKQMTDFTQNMYNAMSNFGKPAAEVNTSFEGINNAWTGIYDSWMKTMNTTYQNLSGNMSNGMNKNVFENMFQAQSTMLKLQEFYAPFLKAMQGGNANMDAFKKMMDPAEYKKNIEGLFTNMFPQTNMNEMFASYVQQVQSMFGNNQNFSKEINENIQNMMKSYPQLFTGDMGKVMSTYNQMSDTVSKTIAPFVKMMAPGKEKERMESAIETMDKMAIYNLKNTQLQYLMLTAGQKAVEKSIKGVADKFNSNTEVTSFKTFFQEWVNTNEEAYIELFNQDEFSALKAEVMSLSLAIKKDMENQFEQQFSMYPFVFKSEMNELFQTIHTLKNKVKALEAKLAVHNASTVELEEDEEVKTTTKTARKK